MIETTQKSYDISPLFTFAFFLPQQHYHHLPKHFLFCCHNSYKSISVPHAVVPVTLQTPYQFLRMPFWFEPNLCADLVSSIGLKPGQIPICPPNTASQWRKPQSHGCNNTGPWRQGTSWPMLWRYPALSPPKVGKYLAIWSAYNCLTKPFCAGRRALEQ